MTDIKQTVARAVLEYCDIDPDTSLSGDNQNFRWMEYAETEWPVIVQAIEEAGFAIVPDIKWECFLDRSSWDMWCVRPIGEREYGNGFYMINQESAEGLKDFLNNRAMLTASKESQPDNN